MENTNELKLFITGLCLQGNKGGPALALSMREALSTQLNLGQITLSVPGGVDFKYEKDAAQIYGFTVVESVGPKSLLPPFCFLKSRFDRASSWITALKNADAIVDMIAISYVGPPIGKIRNILAGRFFYFLLAKFFRKPFIAWTQSYGPFSNNIVKGLAKLDLREQPIIFCRGDGCAQAVKEILPNKVVRSFPDVATILPFDKEAGKTQLTSKIGYLPTSIVTVSPSAEIYSRSQGEKENNTHVRNMVDVCAWLNSQGFHVVFVPHTLRKYKAGPNSCDLKVSELIYNQLANKKGFSLIDDDLTPIELKSIISNADLHIGGRYHSIVAALSSGVASISLSWHPKYQDLMHAYGMQDYVIDAVNASSNELILEQAKALLSNKSTVRKTLSAHQNEIASHIDENAQLFAQCLQTKFKI